MKNEFDVVVIGGGTTGTAVIRDLVMRGFHKSILLDRDDLAAGTSGACHSALHAGSRYVISDRETAIECVQENEYYRYICPQVMIRRIHTGFVQETNMSSSLMSG